MFFANVRWHLEKLKCQATEDISFRAFVHSWPCNSCFPFDEVWSCFFSLRRRNDGPALSRDVGFRDLAENLQHPSTWSLILLYHVWYYGILSWPFHAISIFGPRFQFAALQLSMEASWHWKASTATPCAWEMSWRLAWQLELWLLCQPTSRVQWEEAMDFNELRCQWSCCSGSGCGRNMPVHWLKILTISHPLYPWFPFINTAVSVGGNPCCQALTTNQWRSPRCAAASSSGAVPCEVPRAGLSLGWQGTLAPMKWISNGEFHKDQNWTTDKPMSFWSMDRMHIVPFGVRSWNVLFCFDACARLAYSYMAASWGGYVFVLPLGRLAERCCCLLLHKEWWPALFSMVSSLSESWRNTQLER